MDINMKKILLNVFFCLKLLFAANKINFILLLFINLISLLNPFVSLYVTRILINELVIILSGSYQKDINYLYSIILIYASFSVLMRFVEGYIEKLTDLQLREMVSYINMNLIKKSAEIDISYFDIPEIYDNITHSRENAQGLHQVIFSIFRLINNFITIIIYIFIAIKTSIVMAGIVLVLLIPNFCFKTQIDKRAYGFTKEQYRDIRKNVYVYNLLFNPRSAKELRFFDVGNVLCSEYISKAKELVNARIKFTKDKKKFSIILDIPSFLLQGVINIYIIIKILQREKMLGDYSFFTGVYNNLYNGLLGFANVLAEFMAFSDKINDFKQYFSLHDNKVKGGTLTLDEIEVIEFVNVTFGYPQSNEIVLDNVNFKIEKGKWALLIGLNGSGKSTISKLLARFYDSDSGQILINDVDITLYNINVLRNKMAILFQDYNIFSFTVRENIAISNLDMIENDSAIKESMASTNINYLLERSNSDLDTYVSKVFSNSGVELSGGEKQKMAFARVFFKNSDTIILDEPTAALDAFSENYILSKLKEKKKKKIIIMISHKLLHAKYVDQIILLKNGKVEAQGNHGMLYDTNEEYRQMYNLQLDKYKVEVM